MIGSALFLIGLVSGPSPDAQQDVLDMDRVAKCTAASLFLAQQLEADDLAAAQARSDNAFVWIMLAAEKFEGSDEAFGETMADAVTDFQRNIGPDATNPAYVTDLIASCDLLQVQFASEFAKLPVAPPTPPPPPPKPRDGADVYTSPDPRQIDGPEYGAPIEGWSVRSAGRGCAMQTRTVDGGVLTIAFAGRAAEPEIVVSHPDWAPVPAGRTIGLSIQTLDQPDWAATDRIDRAERREEWPRSVIRFDWSLDNLFDRLFIRRPLVLVLDGHDPAVFPMPNGLEAMDRLARCADAAHEARVEANR